MDGVVLITGDDQRFIQQVLTHIISRVTDLGYMSDRDPSRFENPLTLDLEELRRAVTVRRQTVHVGVGVGGRHVLTKHISGVAHERFTLSVALSGLNGI
tara:strand:- start:491 stop:787 length:297 start_codon:yes stop_codon:yes gene_type:complete